ncbi:MAG: molecular chaperone DnaJ [Actinomycetota bacterium]|nr:molecular chaperone DnaJ [Actinomycetota bacterium]
MKDYYQMLGVDRNADQEDIKRAYRKLARRYHPDVNSTDESAEGRFKEISEAYEVLGNAEKRKRYDMFGEEGVSSSVFDRGFGGFDTPFGDVFEMFFGRGQSRGWSAPRRGSDLLYSLQIDLEEAFEGAEKEIEIPRNAPCEDCDGKGIEAGFNYDLCPDCGGEGKMTRTRRSSFGTFSSTTNCRRCGGTGEINTHPCPSCGGRGYKHGEERIKITIPPGIGTGDRMRVQAKGEAGSMGAPTGDLYVEIIVREHDIFSREGNDLTAAVEVSMIEAALGTELKIPTLDGEEKLQVPPGSQPGKVFRLPGKGMPRLHHRGKGDLFLALNITVPTRMTSEQRGLLEDYLRIEEEKEKVPGFVERLKKAMRV